MTGKLFDPHLDLLERRFQALRDQIEATSEACRPELAAALRELSQAIAALRADREAGESPQPAPLSGREAQAGQGGESHSPVDQAAYLSPCEAMLHHVFNAIPDLLTVHDRDFNTIMSNWHGYESLPEAERRGRPKCYQVYHHRDRPCDNCHAPEVLATGQPVKVTKVNPADGRVREVSAYPIRDESGRVVLVVEHVREITDRHLAEQALKESEGRFRTLIEDSPESLFLTDVQGTVLAASRVAARRIRKKMSEVVGRSAFEHLPPEVASRRLALFEQVIATGRPVRFEDVRDGIHFDINFNPILDADGKVARLSILAIDITDRKNAEQALKESEERFRAIFATAQDSIFIKDRSYRYTQVNPAMERLFGRPAAEIIGKTDLDLMGAADTERIRKQDRRVLNGEVVKGAHTVPVQGVPITFHYIKAPLHDEAGEIVGICGIARDITDLRRAEDALEESEERFRMLFDHVPDAYILADMQGEIIECNQATEELAGYGREELVGNNFACLPWLDFRQQVRLADLLAQTARGEVMGPVDFTLTRKDGGEVIAEGMSLPLYIQGQNLVLTIVRDITARKLAEAALKENEARFRHISSTISDISYSCKIGPGGSYAIDWLAGAVERITGYAVEEIQARHCWKFLVIEADQPLFEKHITGLAAGSSGACELRLRHKNGGIVWVASFAKLVPEPEQPGLLSLYGGLVDITARKQVEEALKESEERYRALFEASPDAINVMDLEMNFLMANQRGMQLFGHGGIEESRPPKGLDYVAPEERPQVIAAITDLLETGQTQTIEVTMLKQDGTRFRCQASVTLIRDAAGRPQAILGVARDITELKQAEEALKESEARYRALFEASPDAITLMDMEMNFVMGNRRGLEIWGQDSLDPATSRKAIECITPEDRPLVMAAMQELMTTGRAQTFETTMLKPDGSWFPSLNSAALIRDVEGLPQTIIGIARDITALKQAEAGLRESEELFRSLVEHIALGITMISSDYRITMTNPAQGNLFHKHPREFVGKECFREFEKRQAVCPNCPGAVAMATGQKAEVETTGVRDDGSSLVVRIHAFPSFGPDGEINGFIEVVEDITQSKQVEVALQESEKRFRLMAETIQDVFWIATRRIGKTVYVSPGFEYIWGRTRKALYRNPKLFLETVHPEDRERVKTEIIAAREQSIPWSHEYRIIRPDGTVRWIQNRGFPVRDDQGIVTLFTGVATDVTEHKALEGQLLQAQKMEAVGRLAGGVAHDFNNLLMAITGYGELMRAKVLKDDPLYGHLENILKAGDRAAALTQQLLTFSRQKIVHPQVIDLNRVVLDLEAMLRRLIGEDLDLEVVTDRNQAAVKADPGQMGQIIMNLVVNARDAMPQGGRLILKTAAVDLREDRYTRFGLAPPGAYVRLEVQDTGVGMDEATQAHVFEPFFTTKEQGKGTGLGLSTVYGIVKQSGGYLELASEPGAGSTFTIYLPRMKEIVAPPKAKIPITASFQGEETILLVEDEDMLRGLLSKFLRLYGYTVLEARHGGEALLTCERYPGPIHLMVTDVVMPQMSGRELADRLTPLRPEMKILYMSGYTEDALVQHGVVDLSVAFLQKPFRPIELARRVHAVLHPPVNQ